MTIFADPYKKCRACGQWIDGTEDQPGPLVLIPCAHRSDYRDVCPSWGPVDGCTCTGYNTRHPDDLIVHDRRIPAPGDTRVYGAGHPRPAARLVSGSGRP